MRSWGYFNAKIKVYLDYKQALKCNAPWVVQNSIHRQQFNNNYCYYKVLD